MDVTFLEFLFWRGVCVCVERGCADKFYFIRRVVRSGDFSSVCEIIRMWSNKWPKALNAVT